MTVLGLGESIGRYLAGQGDRIETEETHGKVVHRVFIGEQVFVVTCQEAVPDKREPAV